MQASAPLKTRACVLAHLTPLVRVFAMLPQVARWVCALAGSLWSLRLGLGVYAFHVTNQLERPGYTVVRQLSGGVELRATSGRNFLVPASDDDCRGRSGWRLVLEGASGWNCFMAAPPKPCCYTAVLRSAPCVAVQLFAQWAYECAGFQLSRVSQSVALL